MSKIKVSVSDFVDPFRGLNGSNKLNISKIHFLKYGMTAGMPLFGGPGVPPLQALTLAMYKAIGISCALDFTSPYLKRSSSYSNLDPTEQANISTWVGMAGAAFMADVNLDVSQLVHAGALRKNGALQVSDFKSRRLADFVGQDTNGNWHVLEAKARQNNPSSKERIKWKTQAQTIATINNIAPTTQSYCYTKINNPCCLELVDPPVREEDTIRFWIDDFELIRTYYKVLLEVLKDSDRKLMIGNNSIRYIMAGFDPITQTYIHVGMQDKVYNMIEREQNPPKIEPISEKPFFTKLEEIPDERDFEQPENIIRDQFFLASDGVAVATSKYPNEIKIYDHRYQ
ncbi:MAG: hypothetical protein SCH66_10680 [Methanolobus sp.]|nr:hypothetical protein [Methanolobus sp.]